MKTLKKFKVVGISRDFDTCDCCGKTNLQKVVAIMDLDHDVINYFGVNCASSVEKYDSLESAKLAKKEISKSVRKFTEQENWDKMYMNKLLQKHFGVTVLDGGRRGIKLNCSNEIWEKNWKSYQNNKKEFKVIF